MKLQTMQVKYEAGGGDLWNGVEWFMCNGSVTDTHWWRGSAESGENTRSGNGRGRCVWWWWWWWCGPVCNDACLSMTTHEMHLIMGAVSLWTRPPALHLCAGP